MEVIKISKEIESRIEGLKSLRGRIKHFSETRAKSMSEYEKQLAITIIKLKNGEVMELEGNKIEAPPATVMEKIAKGMCYKAKLDMETAEALYKGLIVSINAVEAELNGFQSIFRHLSET